MTANYNMAFTKMVAKVSKNPSQFLHKNDKRLHNGQKPTPGGFIIDSFEKPGEESDAWKSGKNAVHRPAGPRGRGEDHPGGGHSVPFGKTQRSWAGWITGTASWIPTAWSGSGASPSFPSRRCSRWATRPDAAGYAGACGLFRRDGTGAAGAGLRGAGHQRYRRRPGPYRDPLAPAGALTGPGLLFVTKMDLPGPGGGADGGAARAWTSAAWISHPAATREELALCGERPWSAIWSGELRGRKPCARIAPGGCSRASSARA